MLWIWRKEHSGLPIQSPTRFWFLNGPQRAQQKVFSHFGFLFFFPFPQSLRKHQIWIISDVSLSFFLSLCELRGKTVAAGWRVRHHMLLPFLILYLLFKTKPNFNQQKIKFPVGYTASAATLIILRDDTSPFYMQNYYWLFFFFLQLISFHRPAQAPLCVHLRWLISWAIFNYLNHYLISN